MKTKQIIEGKMTYIGVALTAIGAVAQATGHSTEFSQATGAIDLVTQNWETIQQTGGVILGWLGIITSWWGKFRQQFRG